MLKFLLLLTFSLYFCVNSLQLPNETDYRRVYFGVPKYDYRPPWSAVASLRMYKRINGQLVQCSFCSAILIGRSEALTAGKSLLKLV